MNRAVKAVVRDEMRVYADAIRDALPMVSDKLDGWAARLHNRPAKKRAGVSSAKATPELKAELRHYAIAHPDIPNREIGALFNVDGGRVSEARHGE